MGKIMAIDYGKKRCGIAVTDDMQIIASGLETIETRDIFEFLKKYFVENQVDSIVVGLPTDLKGNLSEVETEILKFLERFKSEFPEVEIHRFDERFTSKMAFQTMIDSGLKKKQRQNKALIDEISATIMLQDYLTRKMF